MYTWKILTLLVFLILSNASVFSQNLVINEILSNNNSGISDEYGDHSDWIEIVNLSNYAVNLDGYYLSDKKEDPLKWRFPNTTVPANGFVLVFASKKESINNELHTNFLLSADGEYVLLSNPNGDLLHQLDSVPMYEDVSYGYKPDGVGELLFFPETTPLQSNITQGYQGFLSLPTLSKEPGFYEETISVEVLHEDANVVLRYTLDGSEPSFDSPIYETSLVFDDVASNPNGISEIKTNPSFDFPKPGYTESCANSRGWVQPYSIINKSNTLKVGAFKDGYVTSSTVSATYFVNLLLNEMYEYPIISITTNADSLFSEDRGIYVYGTTGEEGNYNESGREWEREVNFQLFNEDGQLEVDQNLGARIHGGGGRHSTLKNLRMYARDDYGKSKFKYKWFDNSDNSTFKRFIVRGSGNRPNCTPRDDIADMLIQNYDMDIQHYKHVIVFINGEYWGIHTIKERFDQDYLEIKYGKKEDDYVILKNSGTLYAGEPEDLLVYYNLLDFVTESDMTLNENYEHVKFQVDMDNYLSYYTSEVFMGNVDWVNANIRFWRYKGFDKSDINGSLDGRWRWFMYGFDGAFGHSCNRVSYNMNVLDDSFDPDIVPSRATKLARGLKHNEQWRFDFVNKMCDIMNSNFNHKNVNEKINEIDAILRPELPEHIDRWRYPSIAETLMEREDEVPSMDKWNNTIAEFRDFNDNRKEVIIGQMQAEFEIGDTIHVVLSVNDKDMGNIKVNSIFISEALDGVSDELYPWHGTYFKNVHFPLVAIPKLGYLFVEWQETGETNDSIVVELSAGDTYTAVFEEDPDFVFDDALYINEFMASNKTNITDEYEAHADWIEIYNPNNQAIDLASFFISDDADEPYKYRFPRGYKNTILPALGYMLIWTDDRDERGPLHTNFKLSAAGEDIVLLAPDSSLIDNLTFGVQQEDISFGREKDGDDAWKFFQTPIDPTPGQTNNNASVSDIVNVNTLNLYPNPVAKGREVYFSHVVNIEVYNAKGQLLLNKKNASKLETNNFDSGIYLIKTEKRGVLKLLVE
ncbi:MAG: CotH kinase family protein [Bacteroidales bacterium]|nr:CotH kinase family protein [Bacteroidales bacterium]